MASTGTENKKRKRSPDPSFHAQQPATRPKLTDAMPNYDAELDPKGDLVLTVGPEKNRFRVCSRTMARTSKVFERMLYGPFKEGRDQVVQGKEWAVELPEDNADALQVVLKVIHGNIDQVPEKLERPELLAITKLTHFYDMTQALRAHWNGWLTKLPVERIVFERLICDVQIAIELGDLNLFIKVLRPLVAYCHTDPKSGQLYYSQHSIYNPTFKAEGIPEATYVMSLNDELIAADLLGT